MANVRVVLNRKGVRYLLRSDEIRRDLTRRGAAIARAAGPGHEVDSEVGRNRVRVSIRTATFDAALAEATGHTLTRALDAGRR